MHPLPPQILMSTPARLARAVRWVPCLVLAAGLLVSWSVYDTRQRNFAERLQEEFISDTGEAHAAIAARLGLYAHYLYGLQALFAVSDEVTRADFNHYINTVDIYRRHPGIQVTAFTRRVLPAGKAAFEQRVRSDTSLRPEGYPGFRIRPDGERPEYFVAEYVEPLAGNQALLGFDQGSEATRRRAVEKVRDTGTLTASGRITLIQDAARNTSTPGFQLRLPVYRPGMPLATVAQRQAAFAGLIGSAFRATDLVQRAVPEPLLGRLRIRVYDAGETDAPLLPADDKTLLHDNAASVAAAATAWQGARHSREMSHAVGDRRWRVLYDWHRVLPPGYELGITLWWGGTLVSLLLALLTWGLLRARQVVSAERAQHAALLHSQAALAASEARFRDLTELSSDWYWETDTEHRFVYLSDQVDARSGVSTVEHMGKRRWEIPNSGVSAAAWDAHRAQLARREPFLGWVMGRVPAGHSTGTPRALAW